MDVSFFLQHIDITDFSLSTQKDYRYILYKGKPQQYQISITFWSFEDIQCV